MKRRDFIKGTLAASALAGLSTPAAEAKGPQEYYQLRVFRLKKDADATLLHNYLEKAVVPAFSRMGLKPVGVFTEADSSKDPAIFVLIPYPNLEAFSSVTARLKADSEYRSAGEEYLQRPPDKAVFTRIDSWFLRAFAGMPKIELPEYSREKKARIFELRTYESYSEAKALKKVDMFNEGEIDIMREVGLGPVFFGQALIGANLPHLTYMLSAESRDAHKQHWGAFGKNPAWKKMSGDAQYKDTVSKIYNHFLEPTAYSQI